MGHGAWGMGQGFANLKVWALGISPLLPLSPSPLLPFSPSPLWRKSTILF
ncbi:hypothetical protein H6F73_21040 [Microcoleus sp. FACHB-68]|nr:hypothetical protein [Microcoleus sp. FACHB-68]